MTGYFGRPEATAEAFRGGWLHTGDLAVQDERGYYFFRDRLKEMIKTGGENVYSAEIEQALHLHPAVLEAAVVGFRTRAGTRRCAPSSYSATGCRPTRRGTFRVPARASGRVQDPQKDRLHGRGGAAAVRCRQAREVPA